MVRNYLWQKAGGGCGFLCIGCLEKRIGYRLSSSDFTNFPVNDPHPWDTPRLAARKSG